MSAFALFFFQHPNLLEYQRRMKKKSGRSNLERVFGIEDLPSDTQMREILDGAPIEPLLGVLSDVFERMRRVGWTARFVTEVEGRKYYTVALDGSQYFSSTKIECPGCLRRADKTGEIHYSHVVVGATMVTFRITSICEGCATGPVAFSGLAVNIITPALGARDSLRPGFHSR